MATNATVTLRVRWWVRPYLQALVLCAWVTGSEPNWDKVTRTCRRGLFVVNRNA